MTKISKEKKISGRDRAYHYIRNTVLADIAMAGTFLAEQELADQIGVSRTPVREALFMLATENLVQLVPNRGALVVPPSPDEIQQVMQAREMIEIWAANHGTVDLRAIAQRLRLRLREQTDLPPAASLDAFIELDRLFHLELIQVSGNAVLTQMYNVLQARHFTLGVKAMMRSAGRRTQVLSEHAAIVEAFDCADIARVEAAIRTHLAATFRSLVLPR